MRFKKILTLRKFQIFGIILIAFIAPFRLTIAPVRTLKIVEPDHTPVKGATIEQNVHQYSLNFHKSTEYKSDLNGDVTIPRQSTYTNVLLMIWGAVRETARVGLEAGYGSEESIGVFVNGYKDTWFYNGEGLDNDLIVLGQMGTEIERSE